MKHLCKLLFCLLPLCAAAQQKGIHFQHGLTWQQVQAKAKAEHKYIFMDCFATWCGPCRYMSTTIFPMQEVGDKMNAEFINIKVQLDTTAADNAEIKSWYASGHNIAKQYEVVAYPTYLFFSPDGQLVHRAVGSSDAASFLAKADAATNPDAQYYTLMKKYKAGSRDAEFLYKAAKASLDAYDTRNGKKIAEDYFATQTDLYTQKNIELLSNFTESSEDKGFTVMLNNADKADAVLGKGSADKIINNIILREEVFPVIFPQHGQPLKNAPEPNWSNLQTSLGTKYPARAASLTSYSKAIFYMNTNDWAKFGPAVVDYMKSYGNATDVNELNQFAWTVFQNCSDEACLQNALEWSKRSFEKEQNPAFMDTYANILYRLGKKGEAIDWEQKAMTLVTTEEEKKGYQQTIDKMKNDEKTWN